MLHKSAAKTTGLIGSIENLIIQGGFVKEYPAERGMISFFAYKIADNIIFNSN